MRDREGTLPAPHCAIHMKVSPSLPYVYVRYTGTPPQLRAAGIVDDFMENKILNQRSGAMLDRNGVRFSIYAADRETNRELRKKRVAWEHGGLVEVELLADCEERALALPGVRTLCPDGIPDGYHQAPKKTPATSSLNGIRERCVGRWRRQVRWAAIENVIWPDWREVQSGYSRGMMSQT